MAYDRDQFRDLTERVLKRYNLHSEAAVALLLGTAATESDFGTFLRQKGGGPALGVFQMEPATFLDLKRRYGERFPYLWNYQPFQLETNLELAILTARCKYMDDPAPLPDADNVVGMAKVYKKWFNSVLGKGSVEKFLTDWKRYLATT
jgi:hypothetical protein